MNKINPFNQSQKSTTQYFQRKNFVGLIPYGFSTCRKPFIGVFIIFCVIDNPVEIEQDIPVKLNTHQGLAAIKIVNFLLSSYCHSSPFSSNLL
jgi:hypothetical protein